MKNMLDNKPFEDWKKCREIGELNFILIYGVLYFGSAMSLFSLFKSDVSQPALTLLIATCYMGGFAFGKLVWFCNEKKFSSEMPELEKAFNFKEALVEVGLFFKRKFDADYFEGYVFLGEKITYGRWLHQRIDGGPDRRYHSNKKWKVSIKSWRHLETGKIETCKTEGYANFHGDMR
ncbi:hypothetical protein [Vibrio kanaloae]|uniref:Uncharacterized protein n=1 Tax=Vibrio kanaloae TaxID=170673 RepID=A0A4V5R2U5_9VIBR|nr:hypothetical protein [Vibrio kanaloae]TKF22838.1 hypothetical protein FCV52_19175 [Vibrio kanaloae]